MTDAERKKAEEAERKRKNAEEMAAQTKAYQAAARPVVKKKVVVKKTKTRRRTYATKLPILDPVAPWTAVPKYVRPGRTMVDKKVERPKPFPMGTTRMSFPMWEETVFSPFGLSQDKKDTVREYNSEYRQQKARERVRLRAVARAKKKNPIHWHADLLGEGQSTKDFIKNGKRNVDSPLTSLGKALGSGIEGYGRRRREKARENTERYGLFQGSLRNLGDELEREVDIVGGKSLANTIFHQEGDHKWEAGLQALALPVAGLKGFPMLGTGLIRAVQGAVRIRRAEEGGGALRGALAGVNMTRADRSRTVRDAAMKAPDVVTASSRPAKAVADLIDKAFGPNNPLGRAVRNDPRSERVWTYNGDTLTTPHTLARTGKLYEKLIDGMRPEQWGKLGRTTIGRLFADEHKMYSKALAVQYKIREARWIHQAQKIAAATPRNWLGRVDVPTVYAIRMLGNNLSPDDMLRTLAGEFDTALNSGDQIGMASHTFHQGAVAKAADLVTVDPETNRVVWSAKASAKQRRLYRELSSGASSRESLLDDLDLLMRSEAEQRVINASLVWHGAQYRQTAEYYAERLAASPNRRVLVEKYGEDSPYVTALDGMAVRWSAMHTEQLSAYEAGLRATGDLVEADAVKAELARKIDPDEFYAQVDEIALTATPKEMDELTARHGPDVRFRSGEDASRASIIAKAIKERGLKLPDELQGEGKLEEAVQRVYAMARQNAAHRDWYDRAADNVLFVSEATGVSPKQVAELFAIFSQASDTVVNVKFLKTAIEQWKTHGKIYAGRFPERQSAEAEAVLRGEAWKGRKRSSFYQNIIEKIHPEESTGKPVTVDRWVVRMFMPESSRHVPAQYYDTFEQIIQEMGAAVGWKPKEIQAAAWVTMKEQSLQAATWSGARHLAGSQDAFEYGLNKYFRQSEFDLGLTGSTHPDTLRAINAAKRPDGGFTLYADLTDAKPTGYVAAYGAFEYRLPAKALTPKELELYRDTHLPHLKDKRARVGGWHNSEDGDVYLDISKEFKTKTAAVKFGKEQGQVAIFDTRTFASIPTGLTDAEADAIKSRLKSVGRKVVLPPQLLAKESAPTSSLPAEVQAYEDFLEQEIVKLEWPKTKDSRRYVEELFFEKARQNPDAPWAKNFFTLSERASEAERAEADRLTDEAFGPATEGLALRGEEQNVHGFFNPEGNRIALSEHGPDVTGLHEFVHRALATSTKHPNPRLFADDFVDLLGRHVGVRDGVWTKAQEERAVSLFEAVLLDFREGTSKMHPKLVKAFEAIRKEMVAQEKEMPGLYGGAADELLAGLPDNVREAVEGVFWWIDETNRGFHGARKGNRLGDVYLPETPGLPIGFTKQSLMIIPRAYRRLSEGANTLEGKDDALSHMFTGALIRGGRWERDITKGSTSSLMKASNIDGMQAVRERVLRVGTKKPEDKTDVFVLIDPKDVPDELRRQVDAARLIFQQMDSGKKISEQEVHQFSRQDIEDLREFMFPGISGKNRSTEILADEIKQGVREPIEGGLWVPRSLLLDTGLFDKPYIDPSHSGVRGLVKGIDTLNNALKIGILASNPAYYPMNLMGQGGMLVAQQLGLHRPMGVLRAGNIRMGLGEDASFLDIIGGAGQSSVLLSQGGGFQKVTDASARLGNLIIDKYPRGMATLYEAARLGYRDTDQVRSLLFDPRYVDDLLRVMTRSRASMIDFNNLSQFEREVLTRIIFVYPWLKASTYWTSRFPKDHPMQAAAFMGALYLQQERLKEYFPDGVPGYMEFALPLDKSEDSVYAMRLDQLLPVFQTLSLYSKAADWVGGDFGGLPGATIAVSDESIASILSPLLEAVISTVGGRDTFTGQEVESSIPGFLKQLNPAERIVAIGKIQDALQGAKSDLYPMSKFQEWLRVFTGSLTPINIDPQEAAERAARVGGDQAKAAQQEWENKYKDMYGQDPSPELLAQKRRSQQYDSLTRKFKEERGVSHLRPQEKLAVLLRVYAENVRPEDKDRVLSQVEKALSLGDDSAETYIEQLWKALQLDRWGRNETQFGKDYDEWLRRQG